MKKLIVTAALALSSTAFAGAVNPGFAYCTVYSDNSGFCEGTFRGFQATTNGADYVTFAYRTSGTSYFGASLNGRQYTCYPSTTMQGLWDKMQFLTESLWAITWDATGTCTAMSFQNSSAYVK
jgi:hypothetical protein